MVPAQSARRRMFILTSLLGSTLATMATSPALISVRSNSPRPLPVVLLAAQPEVRVRVHFTLRSQDALPHVHGNAQVVLSPTLDANGQGNADAGGADAGAVMAARVAVRLQTGGAMDGGVAEDGGRVAGETQGVVVRYPLAEAVESGPVTVFANCQGATVCEHDVVVTFTAQDLDADTTARVVWEAQAEAFYSEDTVAGDTLDVTYFQE